MLLQLLNTHFPVHLFSGKYLTQLHKGRFANAIVYRYRDNEYDLVIKDFQHSPWWIRKTFARLFINQEYKGLHRLAEVEGVANRYKRLSDIAIAYDYIEGQPLKELATQGVSPPKSFFKQLERMVAQMHRLGVVHLDLRNMGNILCGTDGKPYIIDFQSAVTFSRFPKWLQRFMRGADMSGVYKAWKKLAIQSLPESKAQYLADYNQIRKRWIFRGYPIQRAYAWACGIFIQAVNSELVQNLLIQF